MVLSKNDCNSTHQSLYSAKPCKNISATQQTANNILQILQKKFTKDFFNKIGNGIFGRGAEAEVINNLFGERLDLTQMEWRRRSW